ncbi:hypothetical protein [Flavobacterium sp. PL002]|uniref:hypothetical protein n=1 Tax=Flavobacterium sp. PL002 TaxID=1897058 RepID=UPI00178801CC|nr:hypothetical protein [Flavobacterium sp. PL002]MBE0392264.1 hypothetical protein [Flavobacterium sp. PL002]
MLRLRILILAIISFGLISCKNSNSEKQIKKVFNSPKDSILYNNYVNAIENGSTFQYFTVIKVKDINTGKVREICTKGDFLWGALHIEYDSSYSNIGLKKIHKMLLENKERYFQLKDTAALNNLGLNRYSPDDLKKFEKENNVDSIAKSIKGKWGISISEDKNMLLLAHSLFDRGILTGENNCFGGNLMNVDKQMLDERKKHLEEIKAMSKKQ